MGYNPEKHHRKSIRLKGYDYSSAGAYFITICVKKRKCLFGDICTGEMILNDFGKIIAYHWKNIPSHFHNAKLDEFVVMPNHFHGILWLVDDGNLHVGDDNDTDVGSTHSANKTGTCRGEAFRLKYGDKSTILPGNASPLQPSVRPRGTKPGSLSAIIQNFSSVTTRKINRIRKTPGEKLWQRNFYDRIIRTENELHNVRQYILNNPLKWELDSASRK